MSGNDNIITQFIRNEFNKFKEAIVKENLSHLQGTQSLSMAWMSYYYQDEIDNRLGSEIENYVIQLYSHPNYNTKLWIFMPALESTAWLLTRNEDILRKLLWGIAAEQSHYRLFMQEAVAIVAPLIPYDHVVIKAALAHNFRGRHFYKDHSLLIYLSTYGPKEKILDYVESIIEEPSDDISELISEYRTDGSVKSIPFFMRSHVESLLYAMNSIINITSGQSTDLFSRAPVDWELMYIKMRDHPLA
jgi:hypothetical protein